MLRLSMNLVLVQFVCSGIGKNLGLQERGLSLAETARCESDKFFVLHSAWSSALLLKNTPGHPEQFFVSSTAPLLMEDLPTHAFVGNARHFLYTSSFRQRASQINMFG